MQKMSTDCCLDATVGNIVKFGGYVQLLTISNLNYLMKIDNWSRMFFRKSHKVWCLLLDTEKIMCGST